MGFRRKADSGPGEDYRSWGWLFPHPEYEPERILVLQRRDSAREKPSDIPAGVPLSVARRFGSRILMEEAED